MRLSMIRAIARAEVRSVRRLVRYWMFAVLSVGSTGLLYVYYAFIHGLASGFSGTAGAASPRYLIGFMGLTLTAIFLLGLLFLAFDVRARDERERMAEVIDSRPLSNVELLVGRGLGLVLMAMAPALFAAGGMQSLGLAALAFDWWGGEPVEPYSLAGFILDSGMIFTVWCAIIMLLAVLVRNRLVVAAAGIGLLGLQMWFFFQAPVYLQNAMSLTGVGALGSDLAPRLFDGSIAQRAGLWLLAAGCVALAAALHPRPDDGSRARRLAAGGGLIVVAGLLAGIAVRGAVADMRGRDAWLAAHEARRDDPRADLAAVTGTVRIDPDRGIELDLELRVRTQPGAPLATLLFTLNPGLSVERVAVAGAEAAWTHDAGLLEITPSSMPPPPAEVSVALAASGRPDTTFGYLDAGIDMARGDFADAQIALLGIEPGVFSSKYVALMPGLGWLPHTGSDVPAGDPRTHPDDYFEVELEVEVPAGWLVAGPGRRQPVGPAGGETARFRFQPVAPVPRVGLLASRFERRAVEVAGVELEILVHPAHDRNLRFFEDAAGEIRTRAQEILTEAASLGLPYPYGGLTLVETPWTLRGYGGGWRMDTTQAMPGVLLLRENSFTTARFEFAFRDPGSFAEREGGVARAKLEAAERFFENDFSGGNLFLGGSRNFLLYQTGAKGAGAPAIDFVLDALVTELLTGKRGYFSPFSFDQDMGWLIGETITNVVSGRTDSVVEALLDAAADRPSVWDRALGASLAELDPTEDPARALDVLALKGHAIARSILDGLGRERTGALLAELRSRYAGRHFEAADLTRVAAELGADLEPLIGDWLHETALPGFVASPVAVERLADDAQGLPRYQTRVHVRNDEAAPGLLRLRYTTGPGDAGGGPPGLARRWEETEPVRLAGHASVEIGMLGAAPPSELWLRPYLSLNRNDVQLALPRVDEERQSPAEPFLGSRASTWRPAETAALVVDDLDPGFSVESDAAENGWRLSGDLSAAFAPVTDLDQGLPEASDFAGTPREWSRRETASSWGKYRHTIALAAGGDGDRRAVFAAELPRAGRWRLAWHVPVPAGPPIVTEVSEPDIQISVQAGIGFGRPGTYDLTLVAGGEERPIEFDGAAAEPGWNALGEFSLPEGPARLVVSNRTSGRVVVADAIRWEPVAER